MKKTSSVTLGMTNLEYLARVRCESVRASQARVEDVMATALQASVLYSDPDSKTFSSCFL